MLNRGALPLIVLTSVALGFALRVAGLGAQSLWYDEGFSVYLASQPIAEITRLTAGDIHPPFYYYLLHGWIVLAGRNEFALRFLSLLPSVLAVPVVARLAGRAGAPAAAAGALLAAVAPAAVWYGQEARMYALLVLLVALSLDRFLAFVERGKAIAWAGWALASALAIYSHFYGAFVIAAEAALALSWALARLRSPAGRRRGVLLVLGFALIAASYLPWLGPATSRLDGDDSYYPGALDPAQVIRESAVLIAVGGTVDGPLVALGLVAFGGALVAGLWALRRRPLVAGLFLAAVGAPLLLLLAVSWSRPKFHARYLLLTMPAAQALAAGGVGWLVSRRQPLPARLAGAGLAAALAAPLGVSLANAAFDSRYARDDWRAAVAALEVAPRDAVALVSGHAFPVFTYYYAGPYTPVPEGFTLSTRGTLGYNLATTLNELAARADRLWVVRWQDEVVDPNGYLSRLLATGADREPLAAAPHGVGLERYRFRPGVHFSAEPEIAHPLAVSFANALRLLGYERRGGEEAGPLAVPAGGAITLTLYWQAARPLSADYKVALRLVDDHGIVWGRSDRRPAAYFYPTPRWKPGEIVFGDLPVPLDPTTPPGRYWLEVEVYAEDGARLAPLDILDALGNPAGQSTRIATLRVTAPAGPQPPVTIGQPLDATLGAVQVVGSDGTGALGSVRPGQRMLVGAYWRRSGSASTDLQLWLTREGRPIAAAGEGISRAEVEAATPGWVWRAQWQVLIPPDVPAGPLAIELTDGERAVTLARATVEAVERSFSLPETIANRVAVPFGQLAELRGWEVERPTLRPGETLAVRLVWLAQRTAEQPLKVFVHLVDEAGRVVAQRDAEPGEGRWPTTSWLPGQVIQERAAIPLPGGLPAGRYGLVVGMYDPTSGARLPTANGDSLRLGEVTIQ